MAKAHHFQPGSWVESDALSGARTVNRCNSGGTGGMASTADRQDGVVHLRAHNLTCPSYVGYLILNYSK